jgi:hypothetical protein
MLKNPFPRFYMPAGVTVSKQRLGSTEFEKKQTSRQKKCDIRQTGHQSPTPTGGGRADHVDCHGGRMHSKKLIGWRKVKV